MGKFKVGDKIRATEDCDNDMQGGEGTIHSIDGDQIVIKVTKAAKAYRPGALTNEADWGSSIELISKGDTMSECSTDNIVERARDLELEPADRLIKKYGLKHSDNSLTDYGKELLLQTLFAENKSKVVAILKQIDDEAKAQKKASK